MMSQPISFSPFWRTLGLCTAWLLAATSARADVYADVHKLHQAGQTQQALARADAHLAQHAADAQMRFIKANLLGASGQTAQAQALLTTLTQDHPELPEPWNNLAVLHASQGQLGAAQEALEAALRVNPAYPTALENLGDVRLRQALDAWQRAGKLDAATATRLAPRIERLSALLAAGR